MSEPVTVSGWGGATLVECVDCGFKATVSPNPEAAQREVVQAIIEAHRCA